MARSKTKSAFICNDTARRATYRKRKTSILRKVDEISTLCDIEACAIVFNPFTGEAEVTPQDPERLQHVLDRFLEMPDYDQRNNMLDKVSFTRQTLSKAEDRLRRLDKDNMKKEASIAVSQYLENGIMAPGIDPGMLHEMSWQVDETINKIKTKLQNMQLSQGDTYVIQS